jgi:hypothetical protein
MSYCWGFTIAVLDQFKFPISKRWANFDWSENYPLPFVKPALNAGKRLLVKVF